MNRLKDKQESKDSKDHIKESRKYAQTVITNIIRIYNRNVVDDNFANIMQILNTHVISKDYRIQNTVEEIIQKITPSIREYMYSALEIGDKLVAHEMDISQDLAKYAKEEMKNVNDPTAAVSEKVPSRDILRAAGIFDDLSKSKQYSEAQYNKEGLENKEILKNADINIKSIFGRTSIKEISRILNISALYKHAYILLDTGNRANPADNNRFKWNYSSGTVYTPGFFNTYDRITNICGIRLYQIALPFADINPYYQSDYSNWTILIEEFSTQARQYSPDRLYHFSCISFSESSLYCHIRPEDETAALYQFTYPIKVLNSLTLSFATPFGIYQFSPTDRFYIAMEFIYFGFDIDDSQKK